MFSRGRPRQLETEEELYGVALRALMLRAHSVREMQKKLSRYTRNELLLRVVMARLKENGQLDDQRYAQQFARSRILIATPATASLLASSVRHVGVLDSLQGQCRAPAKDD